MTARVQLKRRPSATHDPYTNSCKGTSAINILDAIDDPHLFGQHFKNPQSWVSWRAFLAALFGQQLTDQQQLIYQQCTGRTHPPEGGSTEAWLICGRRSGKSFTLACIAVYLAAFKDWRPFLGPGEVGTIMIIAADRKQARVVLRFIKGLLAAPMLARLVIGATRESISLGNRIVIEVHSASFRSTRGYSICAALLDEIAFWPTDDAAEPDYEVINAIRPGMSTVPGSIMLCASSPYSRKGALWDAHRRHFGKDDSPVLVWQAPTRLMNPSVPQKVIDQALERDPSWAQAEYMARFRADLEAFINREIVMHCVDSGVYERPPIPGIFYSSFLDPAGGSGSDAMSLAIGHAVEGTVVIDALREIRPPFSPEFALAELVSLLKSYGIYTVEGDRWGGEFVREPFRRHNINYTIAAKPKSELYAHHLLPMLNSGRVDLLDHTRAIQQIIGLERHAARSGRESIDHPPGGHDDLSNCIAGLVARVAGGGYDHSGAWISGPEPPREDPRLREERVRKLVELLKSGARVPF